MCACRYRAAAVVLAGLVAASCSSGSTKEATTLPPTSTPSTTTTPASTSTAPAATRPTATSPPSTAATTTTPAVTSGGPPSPPVATSPAASVPGSGGDGFPGATWETVDPAAAGFDPTALDALAATAGAAGSACTVIVRDGRIVDERSWDGVTPDARLQAYSVTKSLTSVLVGIAQDDGALSLDDPAAEYIPAWRGTPAAEVTIEDLLANDSGRHWDVVTDYVRMAIGADDTTQFAIGLPQDTSPGEVWAYNNSAIQTLSAVLQAATGTDPADLAQERVFGPIGMDDSAMTADRSGHTTTFSGLETTCRDLARLGVLALHDGNWAGTQVVSADYLHRATRESSQQLNVAYGWLWWVNKPGPITSPLIATTGHGDTGAAEGPLLPGAPDDVFWALGLGSQIVAVIPSEGIVAVRMGRDPLGGGDFTQTTFTRGVLDALTGP